MASAWHGVEDILFLLCNNRGPDDTEGHFSRAVTEVVESVLALLGHKEVVPRSKQVAVRTNVRLEKKGAWGRGGEGGVSKGRRKRERCAVVKKGGELLT